MVDDIKIVPDLTLEEKAYLSSGKSFWEVHEIEKYNLRVIIVSDGPHGLRKAANISTDEGNGESIQAVCFPTASAQACSFDEDLLFKIGSTLGIECQGENVQVLLGPANNIKRTPLCGRNFEYYSEDPFLASKLATAIIKGIQSQGVGTSLKHFIANNQEKYRMTINAVIDERTLREIYLTAFEEPIKEGKPWTIMASYNRVNGVYVCQNEYLLRNILRNEWKYDGVILSDWGAVDEIAESIHAGMDLEMPTSGDVGPQKIITSVKKKKLAIELLNESTIHIKELLQKANKQKKQNITFSKDEHHQIAREIARECIVLLKNEDNILPITKEKYKSIALLGDFAKNPRFQGGGSSHINPYKVDSLIDKFTAETSDFVIRFAMGYNRNSDDVENDLLSEAVNIAKGSDIAAISVGLPDRYETEGVDRKHLNMPPNQLKLVEEIAKVNKNVVVILSLGSSVKIPFVKNIKGLISGWLLGEAGAGALLDVLLGTSNPSGRLSETFIKNEIDDPSYGNYPGSDEVYYQEGIFVGYRFHEFFNKEVEFEFGYGLSYTEFQYSDLQLSQDSITDTDEVTVSVKVKNVGPRAGKEVIQLYISEERPVVKRPIKELKGFKKTFLEPNEEKIVNFTLTKRSFAYYNVDIEDWYVQTGKFTIMIGKSSKNIVLEKKLFIQSSSEPITLITQKFVYKGRILIKNSKKITRNTRMEVIANHPVGISIYNAMKKEILKRMIPEESSPEKLVMNEQTAIESLNNLPFRDLVNMSQGKGLSERRMNLLIFLLNRTRRDTILGKFIGIFR